MIEKKDGKRMIAEITLSHLNRLCNEQGLSCEPRTGSRVPIKGEFQNRLPQWCDRQFPLPIPNRLILFCRVVRLRPRRSAAPPLPEICPDAAFNASRMTFRSASWKADTGVETLSGEGLGTQHPGLS